jgi:hypothetical protein
MSAEARRSGLPARRIHLVVAIDRLLARLLDGVAPGSWVVKGGYANQLRRPDDARSTEDLDLRIEAAIDAAPALLAAGFAVDLHDGLAYDVATAAAPLQGPPGGGLRFGVVSRLAGTPLVQFKVDLSAGDVVVGQLEAHWSDPVLERLGFVRSEFPVYPVAQHVAEKVHALTLPRDVANSRARDLVDLAWFSRHFTFGSDSLIDACVATFARRATHMWPPSFPNPPADWRKPYERWRAELSLPDGTPEDAAASVGSFLRPVFAGVRDLRWDPEHGTWGAGSPTPPPAPSPSRAATSVRTG